MADIKSNSRQIHITGRPPGVTPEQAKLIVDNVPPGFSGSYEQALATLPTHVHNQIPLPEGFRQAQGQTYADQVRLQTSDRDQVAEQAGDDGGGTYSDQVEELEQNATSQGMTDLMGLMGSTVRGAGPAAAGATVGAAAGLVGGPLAPVTVPAGAGIGALSAGLSNAIGTPIVEWVNRKFGTEIATPREAWTSFFDRMGVPRPDTAAERMVQIAAEGAAAGVGMSGAAALSPATTAQSMQSGGVLTQGGGTQRLAQSTAGQDFLRGMAVNPGRQAVAGVAGEAGQFGYEQSDWLRENLPPWLHTLGGFATNMISDAAATGGLNLAMDTAQAAFRAPPLEEVFDGTTIRQVREEGLGAFRQPLNPRDADIVSEIEAVAPSMKATTDEVIMATNPTQAERTAAARRMTTPSGTGDIMTRRAEATQRYIEDTFQSRFGVESSNFGRANTRTRELARNFVENHQRQFDEAANLRSEVFEQVSGTPVDVQGAREAIAETIADLDPMKSDPRIASAISRLQGWEQMITGNVEGDSIEQVNAFLQLISDSLSDPELGGASTQIQNAVRRVRASLRNDMVEHIREVGGDSAVNQFEVAQSQLADLSQDFNNQRLRDLINQAKDDPQNFSWRAMDELINPSLDTEDVGEGFRRVYSRLDEDGREVAKTAVAGRIIQSADPRNLGLQGIDDAIQLYEPYVNVAMDEKDVNVIEGALEIIRDYGARAQAVANAGRIEGRPELLPGPAGGIATSVAFRQTGLLAGLTGAGLLQKFAGQRANWFQQPQVRDLILNMRRLDPTSQQWRTGMRRLVRALDTVGSSGEAVQYWEDRVGEPIQEPPTGSGASRQF